MGFRSGAYAKVWAVKKGNGNFYEAEMSTSRKAKDRQGNVITENGKTKYETDWAYKFTRLVGSAAKQAETIKPGDSVRIGDCEVTNQYSKEKNTTYTNYLIYSFQTDGDQSTPAPTSKAKKEALHVPDTDDEELPFA